MWVALHNGWLVIDARRVTSCVVKASGLKDHSSQSVSCWANGVSVTHPTINYLCPQLVNERVAPPRRDEAGEEEEEERFGREQDCERMKEKERLRCGNKKTDWEGTEGEVTLGEHKWREKNERQSIKVRTRKNKTLCERKGGEAPGSRWEWGQFENVCDLSVAISLGESYPCSAAL